MNKHQKIILIMLVYIFTAGSVFASNSAGLVNGLWFSSDSITNFGDTTVYSVIHNQTQKQLNGIATLNVDGEAVGAQEVSVGKGDIKRVGISNRFSVGAHIVSMSFTLGNSIDTTLTELSPHKIFVVKDTDGDGIPNTIDLDDDNDGIPDTEDSEPLVRQVIQKSSADISAAGRDFLNQIISRENNKGETKIIEAQKFSTTTNAIASTFRTVENVRKKIVENVRKYENERREKLSKIDVLEKEKIAATEGFEPTIKERSEKREQQLAATGAAVFGFMLDKKWLFYLELIVLTLGIIHLTILWFLSRFKNTVNEEDEE